MNIFVIDSSPEKAASYLCNRHIVKMPTESANLLLWPFKQMGFSMPSAKSGKEIKLSHLNHPCSIWIRESEANFRWALTNLSCMLKEYEARYKRKHYSEKYLNYIKDNLSDLINSGYFKTYGQTPFPRCFGQYKDKLTEEKDCVEAYRSFYKLDKSAFAKWPDKTLVPDWFIDNSSDSSFFLDKSFTNGQYSKR